MKIRLTTASDVIGVQTEKDYVVMPEINAHLNKVASKINTNAIAEWDVIVELIYTKSDWIGVYKRGSTYPSDKEKRMSIIIPIPNQDIANYGMPKKSFVGGNSCLDSAKFWTLPIDYSAYSTLSDLILDCAIRGIDEMFSKGFTVGGHKIKLI